MKRLFWLGCAVMCATASAENTVLVCPITGVIDEGVVVLVERVVNEARAQDVRAIIFRVDTPGGRVDSAVKIAKAIESAHCPTIAFIEGMGAISAGALISLACDDLIMTPSSNIGAATPVIPSAQGMLPTGEKEVSFMRAKMRALAESNGHNPDIAQAMVDKDIELRAYRDDDGVYKVFSVNRSASSDEGEMAPAPRDKSTLEKILEVVGGNIPPPQSVPVQPAVDSQDKTGVADREPGVVVYEDGSELVLAKGKLLTLTPKEAMKFSLIQHMAKSVEEAAEIFELGDAELIEITPTWAEDFYRFLTSPTVAGILLMLGMGGLYFEVKTPGFGLPGIIGATCLALLFGSHYVLGLTDVIDIVLVCVGIILILAEIFVIPGFGIAGTAGILSLIVGLYLSLVDFTIPEYSWQFERLGEVGYSMALATFCFLGMVAVSWRILPRTPIYGRLIMNGTQRVEDGYSVQTGEDYAAAIGLKGKALSMLRPAGRGRFGDKTLTVVSRGDFIKEGTAIEVIEVEGNRYVVDPVNEEDA